MVSTEMVMVATEMVIVSHWMIMVNGGCVPNAEPIMTATPCFAVVADDPKFILIPTPHLATVIQTTPSFRSLPHPPQFAFHLCLIIPEAHSRPSRPRNVTRQLQRRPGASYIILRHTAQRKGAGFLLCPRLPTPPSREGSARGPGNQRINPPLWTHSTAPRAPTRPISPSRLPLIIDEIGGAAPRSGSCVRDPGHCI